MSEAVLSPTVSETVVRSSPSVYAANRPKETTSACWSDSAGRSSSGVDTSSKSSDANEPSRPAIPVIVDHSRSDGPWVDLLGTEIVAGVSATVCVGSSLRPETAFPVPSLFRSCSYAGGTSSAMMLRRATVWWMLMRVDISVAVSVGVAVTSARQTYLE